MSAKPLKIGIVAGEASGDLLGSSLMTAISERTSDVEFVGVGGDTMLASGLTSLADMNHFAVNGFVDPLLRVGSLYRLLRFLVRELSTTDVVVGVDFNVFNLLLERRIRMRGVPTAHYVSPSVYAWRRGRVKRIGNAVDVIMTLFPFETKVYDERNIKAVFVGHPTADRFNPDEDKSSLMSRTRTANGWSEESLILCLMPGSRGSEIGFHFELFLEAARTLQEQVRHPRFEVIVAARHPEVHLSWRNMCASFPSLNVEISSVDATEVLAASDVALVKSGTSTLEAMLMKTPMVVAYRMGSLTVKIVRSMMYIDHIALPNILANKTLVPEFVQNDATPQNLATALFEQLNRDDITLSDEFTSLHRSLKQNAASRAAETVLSLVESR
ncbi:MAG: lipid-A-disaccharide synthase [Gammaproteobacteria bacterium]|nr:lipid-A-disaccharide synthase [Gammaproteobacteria bacterium]